jgi:hypothetical protein
MNKTKPVSALRKNLIKKHEPYTKESFQAFINQLDTSSKDETYDTKQGIAAGVFDDYERWLAPKPEEVIRLPVSYVGCAIRDARGNFVADADTSAQAEAMVTLLNRGLK